MPQGIPPEAMEQIRKMLPPEVQLPPGMNMPANPVRSGVAAKGNPAPQSQAAADKPLPSETGIIGSGRTPTQRAAALAAVNAELDSMACILPKKENAPSKSAVLSIAGDRNASARRLFRPDDLSAYARVVTWTPRFDGLQPDAGKARDYSLTVASITNCVNMPHFVIATAAAVFSLDPGSTANANNLASAIITAGERLHPAPDADPAGPQPNATSGALAPFRRDAESVFLYAMGLSMVADAWTDESLTTIINLGNLYIDLGRLEEARSLFQVARKQSPFSWDAALGMAAYYHATGQPDKALAIIEDEALDRPVKLMVAMKSSRALEKSDAYAALPPESPEEIYEAGIDVINSEPMATAADFMVQLDQETRNQMRYFIEHLPPQRSFTAPSIKKVSQYASVAAISSPQGESALKDFAEMIRVYGITTSAAVGNEQLKMLSRLGLDLNLGIDLDDMAKHPEKYADSKHRPKVKIDKSKLMGNLQNLKKQAAAAERELATGKTGTLMAISAEVDPFFAVLQIPPETYADPMNVIIQKHNFAVHNRKFNLYSGCLYAINKRIFRNVADIQQRYETRMQELKAQKAAREAELVQRIQASTNPDSVEWDIMLHNIHESFHNQANGAADIGFGSATNITSTAYVGKIKPTAEAFYYDVIRHVALISDPEVRDRKAAELRQSINASLVMALGTVLTAHGAFEHYDEWDCGCDLGSLLTQREAERSARDEEETARIMRNKAAKVAFDSGEIPESSPLFKRLDAYGTDFYFFFFKGRISCARTVVHFNVRLPVPGAPELFASQSISENTGAATFGQGIKVGIGTEEKIGGTKVEAGAYLNLSSSVSTDGQGVVKDYSVTAGTGLSVSAQNTSVSVDGEMSFGPNGLKDSDFSAGIGRDFSNAVGKNQLGGAGNISMEASTKRGCSLSGKVAQSLEPVKSAADDIKKARYGEKLSETVPTDAILQKELWSGKFGFLKPD